MFCFFPSNMTRAPQHLSRSIPGNRAAQPDRSRGAIACRAAEAQTAPTVVAVSKVSADGTYNLGETISLPVVFSASDGTTGMSHHLLPNPPRLRAHSPGDYFHRRTGCSVVVEATHPAVHARPGGSTGGFTFASQEAPSC